MIFKKISYCTLLPVVLLFLYGCAAKVVTFEQQLLSEADSLFRAGNYEYAKVKFSKVRELKPQSEAARTAQYYLGYINIYYDNPFSNWEAALREFKLFATLYPEDFRIGEVNSWIRLLVVMQSFDKDFKDIQNKIEHIELANEKSKELEKDSRSGRRLNIDSITESLRNCFNDRDSLYKKTKDLENVIVDLERKCQQAGR